MNLSKQYDDIAATFTKIHDDGNKQSNRAFFETLQTLDISGKRILDLGCGNGTDMTYYREHFSKDIVGLDASKNLLNEAKRKSLNVHLGNFDNLPFTDNEFDIVLSKYALQTLSDLYTMHKEVARVLKIQGLFVHLVVHPIRQFFEKRSDKKDFFKKTIVQSTLFGGKITVSEPTHTLQEYLSKEFLKSFSLRSYIEKADFDSAENITGHEYPTYMIIIGEKR